MTGHTTDGQDILDITEKRGYRYTPEARAALAPWNAGDKAQQDKASEWGTALMIAVITGESAAREIGLAEIQAAFLA